MGTVISVFNYVPFFDMNFLMSGLLGLKVVIITGVSVVFLFLTTSNSSWLNLAALSMCFLRDLMGYPLFK